VGVAGHRDMLSRPWQAAVGVAGQRDMLSRPATVRSVHIPRMAGSKKTN
jgi:hypothetical protein